jgi:ATP-dependent Lon protease
MDVHEYRKFLSNLFPSKHLSKKIKAGEKIKKLISAEEEDSSEADEDWETESEEEEVPKKKTSNKKKSNKKKKVIEESETESESEAEEESEADEESEEDDTEMIVKGSNKFNIIFTIGGAEDEEYEEDDDDYDENYVDSDDDTEDEDASISSSEDSIEAEEEKQPKKNSKNKKDVKSDSSNSEVKPSTNETLEQLKLLLDKNPTDKSIKKCIESYEEDIKQQKVKQEKKDKKYKDKNMRIFRKIIKDKNTTNDFSFYEKLEIEEQKKIIKEVREINKITRIEKPYRITLLESDIPVQFKAAAMKKINSLRYMEPGSGEFYKIKNWVDTFMRIPFGKHEGLPISIEDGVEKCHDFMENAQKTLDAAVYGLNDAKMQIMQMLGQLLTNPKAIGTAIAIHGPPGTGKTSLVKEGISKILNRPFAFIALGGATDSSFLEGHGYTYEGSMWGKIVQILIDSKCMNPVIYFDELDKISDTPRGEEIAGILTHLTDTSQNSQFHDKYFAEINFDLSKCLFIFSYNDESKVNPILKDRMYRIKTKGYSQKEKTNISKSYLLPKICEQVRFNNSEIIIPEPTIHYIIDNHCNKEDGVRNLKRCLEIIHTKLNLYRLMKPGSNLFEQDMSLKVEFPFTVTKDIVDKLIKRENDNISALYSIYS